MLEDLIDLTRPGKYQEFETKDNTLRNRNTIAIDTLHYENSFTSITNESLLKLGNDFEITELQQKRNLFTEQQTNLANALNALACLEARVEELQSLIDRKDINIELLETTLDDANTELTRVQNQTRDLELQQEALLNFNEALTELEEYTNGPLLSDLLDLLGGDDDIFRDYRDDVESYISSTFLPTFKSSVYPETVQAITNADQLTSNIKGTFRYAAELRTPQSFTNLTFADLKLEVSDQGYNYIVEQLTDQEKREYFLNNAFVNFALKLSFLAKNQYTQLDPTKNSKSKVEGQGAKRGSLYEAVTLLYNRLRDNSGVSKYPNIETKRV
jgi:hypothetical protein